MDVEAIAKGLDQTQQALLDDLCGCPGLYAGQYAFHDAGIEYLPRDLWWQSYAGAGGFLGLGKAYPSELGQAVATHLKEINNVT